MLFMIKQQSQIMKYQLSVTSIIYTIFYTKYMYLHMPDHFIGYYKDHFPKSTVFPKLHILQCHTGPWPRVGFGLMGEQGAESIHRWFNSGSIEPYPTK